MQNKEVEALKLLLRQEVYEYFVGGDMPENESDIDDDCLEVMLRIEGVLEYKESKSVIAEIEAAAVERAIKECSTGWVDIELRAPIVSQKKLSAWAANRRKEAQG